MFHASPEKNKKSVLIRRLLKILPRMLSVKLLQEIYQIIFSERFANPHSLGLTPFTPCEIEVIILII